MIEAMTMIGWTVICLFILAIVTILVGDDFND